jgi:WD40 repeat protein
MGPLRGYEDVQLLQLWQQGRLVVERLRHDTPVHRVALGPGDEHVATVAEPATVHIWSAQTGRPRGRVTSATPVRALAVSAGGEMLAAAHDDGTVRVTDVATASPVLAVEADARAVALDDAGRLVAAGLDETLVWSTEIGAEIARAQVGFPVATLALGPGDRLLVAGPERGVAVLETDGGGVTSLPHDGGVLAAAFAPGGERVVTVSTPSFGSAGTSGDGDLRVWDVARRNVVARLTRPEPGVFALSPDGRRIAAATGAEIEVRDVPGGVATHRFGAGAAVTELVFSPDGGLLAVVAGDRRVRVWDLATTEPGPERRLGDAWISGVDPAGRYLAVQASGSSSAWLLDLELDRTLQAEGRDQATSHAALDAGGRFAALMVDLGSVEVRALPSAEVVVRLPHDALGAAFSPDGANLATAGADGSLRVWALPDGAELARMDHADKVFAPCFGEDGRLLATSCADGWVWVWAWRAGDLAAEARARAGRGLTADERATYLPDA